MLPARQTRDDEPYRAGEGFLSAKTLLMIIAGGTADLYVHESHLGGAVVDTTLEPFTAWSYR
jgi:hypothetical protein